MLGHVILLRLNAWFYRNQFNFTLKHRKRKKSQFTHKVWLVEIIMLPSSSTRHQNSNPCIASQHPFWTRNVRTRTVNQSGRHHKFTQSRIITILLFPNGSLYDFITEGFFIGVQIKLQKLMNVMHAHKKNFLFWRGHFITEEFFILKTFISWHLFRVKSEHRSRSSELWSCQPNPFRCVHQSHSIKRNYSPTPKRSRRIINNNGSNQFHTSNPPNI
jgi:hypothetical protein